MKITIKVAQEGDETEGKLHSETFIPVSAKHLSKMLDAVTMFLLIEACDKTLVATSDMKVEVSPNRWVFNDPPKVTEADKKFLKDLNIGGLE
jgi:hypothetical protein